MTKPRKRKTSLTNITTTGLIRMSAERTTSDAAPGKKPRDGYPVKFVERFVEAFLASLRDSLRDGKTVTIAGLFTIEPVIRKEVKMNNPRVNKMITIPERVRLRFKPSKKLLALLNGEELEE